MNRYTIALALTLLAATAMAQTPSVPELRMQLENVTDQLEAAQADRASQAALLDRFKAAVKKLQQVVQQLNGQVATDKAEGAKKDRESADLRRQLGAEKAKSRNLEKASRQIGPKPTDKTPVQAKGK